MALFAQAQAENREQMHILIQTIKISFLEHGKEWTRVYGVSVEKKIETIHHNILHIIQPDKNLQIDEKIH